MALPKFSKVRAVDITLSHGEGEEVVLNIRALPPGWSSLLRSSFKPPNRNVNGSLTPHYTDPEYNDFLAFLYIGKGLSHTDMIETPIDDPSISWAEKARSIRTEFRDAGFTDGDIKALYGALNEVSNVSTRTSKDEGTRGN